MKAVPVLKRESSSTYTGSHITFNGTGSIITDGAITNNTGSATILDEGGGTLTLCGNNTYSGVTTISGDSTLVVANTAGSATGTDTATISVPSGSTLTGSGTISQPVTVSSGGILMPGTSTTPGTINTGKLILSSGSNLDCFISNSASSQVNVTGTVTVTGAYLNLSGSRTSYPGQQLTLINNDGTDAITGTLSGITEGENRRCQPPPP